MAYMLHAGKLMQTANDIAGQFACLHIGHADLVGIDSEVHHVVRFESKIHGLHGRKAAYKQSGDHQQHQRTGDLQGNQAIAEPVASAGHAAAAFVQNSVDICPCDAQRQHHAYNNAGKHCDEKRIEEDAQSKSNDSLTGISACTLR